MDKGKWSKELLLKNMRTMKIPTQLLKCGEKGKPKFYNFQLDATNTYITWDSKTKTPEQCRVPLREISEIRYGQRTPKFARNRLKDQEHLSFSIIYGGSKKGAIRRQGFELDGESLDLVCPDESEFNVWADTLVALVKDPALMEELLVQLGKFGPIIQRFDSTRDLNKSGTVEQMAFQETNDVYTFGWSEWGQTALGTEIQSASAPKVVESLLGKGVVQIACGWSHTAILLESGAVFQCGNRLGTGCDSDFFSPQPTPITEKIGVITIACGSFHTMALTEKGEVLTWGCNFHGQLGHGNTRDSDTPTIIREMPALIEKIAAGGQASAALDADGNMYTWGCGEHGFLGHNDTQDQKQPMVVEDLKGAGIVKLAVGSDFMVASTEREAYSWGFNASGQLGLGHEEEQLRPHVIDALRGNRIVDLSCGAAHCLAVVAIAKFGAKVLYSWGSNSLGQLGQSKKSTANKPTPVDLPHNVNPVEVSCGDLHSCVRDRTGNVYVCGSNIYGQLGLGKEAGPKVMDLTVINSFKEKDCRSVCCGGEHTAVLTAREWIADEEVKECMSCKSAFTAFRRRHHCRNCFGVFCDSCSSKKIAILKTGKTDPVRVCESCYKKLSGRK